MFSSTALRIINAKKINPIGFKNQTLYIDGHDSRIDYLKRILRKESFIHINLKKKWIKDTTSL
jgi:hypothetical protein